MISGLVPVAAWAQTTSLADVDAEQARLEQRLRAHPDDTGTMCSLGWALVRSHYDIEQRFLSGPDSHRARTVLDDAIARIGAPTETALRTRLGACLYSRGRLAEQEEGIAAAIPFYERSIAMRANASVANRLAGARRVVSERWVRLDDVPAGDPASAALEAHASGADLLALFHSRAGDSLIVATTDSGTLVALRDASGAWQEVQSEPAGFEPGALVWLEAPSDGERIRVVVVDRTESRFTMGDGPEYAESAYATTYAVPASGAPRVVSRDVE